MCLRRLLAIAVALGAGAPRFSSAASPTVATGVRDLHRQVRGAKRALETKTELRDYRESPLHPTEIVERIHAMESADAWAALCTELTALPDDELELFEDEVRKPDHARHLGCAPVLEKRLDAFWKAAARQLGDAHPLPSAADARVENVAVIVDVSRDPVFTDGALGPGQIALTFDDGPHPTRTPRVLAILQAAGVKATFFQIGRNAVAHPDVARQVLAAGHTVGSHTFSHPDLQKVPLPHAESEVESGEASVALALGVPTARLPFFRFPYGAKSTGEQAFVSGRGNTTFFWNMDSQDWKIRDPHRLFLNVLQQIDQRGRGIILFHDIHEQTVIVLPHVLAELRARHLQTAVFVAGGARQPAADAR